MWPCSAKCLVFFCIVFTASNHGAASHPPAEKEKQPRPLEKKEGCPKVCRCPVNPTCPPGSPLVADTCGCGCKVCAVGLHSPCDGFRPCEASQYLTCDYLRGPKKHVGICHVSGQSCKEYKFLKYLPVGSNITLESLYYRTSEDEVDHTVTAHGGKTRRRRETSQLVYTASDKWVAFHPPTKKETQRHPLDRKEGCPKACRCPVNPTCAPGRPLVMDTCGCGCKVCAVGWISRCDGFRPCDASQNLTCLYFEGPYLGVCNVIREYRSCFNKGNEVVHGESFYHGCAARCVCDDGKLKCESFCRKYDPPLVDGCSKLRFEKGYGNCCENWSCKEYNATDTLSPHGRLTVLKSIKEGRSPSTTQVDATRQSCFIDGKEILHGQKFKDGCRHLCICANGSGLCIPLCPPTQPEPVADCVEMQLESVPGLCCKKWKCKEYKAMDTKVSPEDLRELEANLSLRNPVVVRMYRSCSLDGPEILHRQEVLWHKCMGRCECIDGAIACKSPCPDHIRAADPGCINSSLVFVPGECCLQRKCMKYQPVDGNITVETLYHRTSEDEVDDTVQVHERKRRSSRESSHTVYTASDKWVAFHPPTKKETQPHPLDRKEGCPKVCRCPVNPTCAPGSPLVLDTCGCGCKVCAVDRLSPCDGFRPCDASQNLTCDYSRGQKKNLGMCNVIREYRSCFNNGNEVVHGESFYHGCAARCDCDDGTLKCESFCRGYDPPLIDGCSKLRLKKEQCCEHWKCTERTATDTKSSQDGLIVLKSIKKGRSPKTQVDATRQSCFVDGKEILHGQKFKDGCRHFCICSNGSGLCLPLCPPTEPEPVAGCVEMQLEAVPGLCCKKWKCMKYKSVDTKVSPEDLRELEANLSLNAPVVIRKHRSCFSDGSEIRHRQEFQLGCVGRCECKDGAVMCVSLCPPSFPAPVPGCIDMDKVAVPGQCCKEWKCTKYQPVDGNITVETLYHRTSEDEVDDTVYEKKRRHIREASRTVYATSDQGDASQPPAEKETQPRPLEKKEGCPKVCKCPVNPTCPPGSPLVADTCGCGCKVCAVGLDSTCDGFRPCDTSQNLTCDYLRSRMKNLGVCHADDTSVVQASSCDKEPTEWTPCSRSCGFGQSFRILYDPESCSPRAEKRLCIVRPCKSQYSNASYTVLKSSKTCNRLVRWQEPLLLNHRGCKSLYPISLRFCGDCADGRVCTPSSTETRLLGFRCRNNRSVTRRIMWVVNCQCNGKGRKKKKEENNTSEAEAEREGGLNVEEQGLKDGGFGV